MAAHFPVGRCLILIDKTNFEMWKTHQAIIWGHERHLRRKSNGVPFKWSTRARGLPSLSKAEGGQHFSKGSQLGPEDVDPKAEGSNPTTSKLFSLQEYLRELSQKVGYFTPIQLLWQ